MPTLNAEKLVSSALKKKKKKEEEPTPEPTPEITKKVEENKPLVFRNEKGSVSGVTLSDGRTFLGLSPDEVEEITQRETKKYATPTGAVEFRDVAQQERLQQLTELTGQLTPEQQALIQQQVEAGNTGLGNINFGQALGAGALEGGIYAAGAGVITGAGTNPVSWVAIGAGGLAGFIKGTYSDIKQQQTGLLKADALNVDRAITQLNNIVSARNLGASAEETQILYQQVVENTYASWVETQLQVRGGLKSLDDGTKELEKFEIFFNPNGGTLSTINLKMNQALVNPNPSKVSASEVGYVE